MATFGISRRQVIRGAAAAAISTLGAPSVQAQKGQQILRFVAQADLQSLDPIWTTAYITRNHGFMVFDTLFAIDSEFTPPSSTSRSGSSAPYAVATIAIWR